MTNSYLVSLFVALAFFTPSLFASEECNDARDHVQICCLNPTACLTSDQRAKQNEVEMYRDSENGELSLKQNAKLKKSAAMLTRIQNELNAAYKKNCSSAIETCIKACDEVDTDFSEDCRKSKAELEKLLIPVATTAAPAAAPEEKKPDSVTETKPSTEKPATPTTPTPEPGEDPISKQH